MHSYISLLTLPLLASAHFHLHFPAARGDDDTNQATFPCGGYEQTQNRTPVALDSFAVSIENGHTESIIGVYLAIGNEVGDSFNYELVPSIQQFGPGDFCWPAIAVPADLNVTEGTNATVQVITNAHNGDGLYNCADITFTSNSPEQPSSCTNGTGISATPLAADAYVLANETTPHEDGHDEPTANASGTESGAASATAGEAAASASASDSASMATAGWGLLGAAVLGAVALM